MQSNSRGGCQFCFSGVRLEKQGTLLRVGVGAYKSMCLRTLTPISSRTPQAGRIGPVLSHSSDRQPDLQNDVGISSLITQPTPSSGSFQSSHPDHQIITKSKQNWCCLFQLKKGMKSTYTEGSQQIIQGLEAEKGMSRKRYVVRKEPLQTEHNTLRQKNEQLTMPYMRVCKVLFYQ